jgi:hypothetical protein
LEFFHVFQNFHFLSGGVPISDYPLIFIYLLIYYIVIFDKELFKHVFCKSIAPNDNLIIYKSLKCHLIF